MNRRGRFLVLVLMTLWTGVPESAAGLPWDPAEIALWDRARSGDRTALRQYLERYPEGYWAARARALAAETTPAPAAPAPVMVLPAAPSALPPPGFGSTGPMTMPPSPSDPGGGLPSGDPVALYDRAFGALRRGEWAAAEHDLADLLRRWPHDDLAPNARYWIAETFFVRGEHARAAAAFAEVYQRSPGAPRAPDALFKEGLARERAGDQYGACTSWARLRRLYPFEASRYGLDERC